MAEKTFLKPEAFTNPTFTGTVTAAGAHIAPASPMAGTVIDVTKRRNTYSATSNPTLTFSGTPTAGSLFGVEFTTDGTARTITIPSSRSFNRGATITSFTIEANSTIAVYWLYDGTTYHVINDPLTQAQAKTALAMTAADVSGLANVATSGAAADVSGLAAVATSGSAADLTTGVLAVARGGTGTATPGLVAGTNITVTGTWPNQTVSSTASGGSSGAAVIFDDGTAAADPAGSANFDDGDATTD